MILLVRNKIQETKKINFSLNTFYICIVSCFFYAVFIFFFKQACCFLLNSCIIFDYITLLFVKLSFEINFYFIYLFVFLLLLEQYGRYRNLSEPEWLVYIQKVKILKFGTTIRGNLVFRNEKKKILKSFRILSLFLSLRLRKIENHNSVKKCTGFQSFFQFQFRGLGTLKKWKKQKPFSESNKMCILQSIQM